MKEYSLNFGKIIIIDENIAEVIVDDGVEMGLQHVDEYQQFLLNHMQTPFGLLVNKVNSYSYTFEAQMKIGTLPEIKAIGIVVYTNAAEQATSYLYKIHEHDKWNLRLFSGRKEALLWLRGELTD
jgi:hypothetical protein